MSMIRTISNLHRDIGKGNYVWIYNWNSASEQFYCIPKQENVIRDPIAVNLSRHFSHKYNHLLIITKNLDKFQERINLLNANVFGGFIDSTSHVYKNEGHLIMKQLNAMDIINGMNKGDAVFVYCPKAKALYEFLKDNYFPFYIEAMGSYRDSVQCFFDHQRRLSSSFGSRGLFEIIGDEKDDVEDTLKFISENVDEDFPPYKITSFDIETARIDDKFPRGNTLNDRLCTVAFQTVSVYDASKPKNYVNVDTIIYAYIPNTESLPSSFQFPVIYCKTEKELVSKSLEYIAQPNAIFITGWNIMKFDYQFLTNKAVYYNLIPSYISEYTFSQMCDLRQVFDLSPPWKLSIDTMECRKKFFPRNLPINPPSNALDVTAKALLDDKCGKSTIDITNINKVYARLEERRETVNDVQYLIDLINYNARDVELVTKLNCVLQIIQVLVPLSQLADLCPGDCINYNSTKIAVTFMKNQFQSVQAAPIDQNLFYSNNKCKSSKYSKITTEADIGKKGTYKGATVLEPELGIHKNASLLGCLDFASLYPSIMLTYGIIRGYVTRMTREDYNLNKVLYDRYFNTLFTPDDLENVYLSCKKSEETPIHYLCKSLIGKRKINKKKAPTVAGALKIIVNSLYGICGVKGILYDEVSAAMITGYGRYHLLKAKNYFEEKYNGLRILYGDTDSVFLCSSSPLIDLNMLMDDYNDHLTRKEGLNAIQLSVDGEFECIIFIRKKLYMAKTIYGGYKFSGFPQRLNPNTHRVMYKSLQQILDIVINTKASEMHSALYSFYQSLFNECIGNDNDDDDNYSYSMKIKPSNSYKSKSGKHYRIASLYEKYTGTNITNDFIYLSLYEIIPLIKQLPKKSFSLCLTDQFDSKIHTVNRSASLTEFFSNTFDPIMSVICGDNDKNTLKQMSQKYIKSLKNKSIMKYKRAGFIIYNFDDDDISQASFLPINVKDSWPSFYDNYISNESLRSKNHKIRWVKEDYEKLNICLRIKLHSQNFDNNRTILSNKKNNMSYVTLVKNPPNILNFSQKKFYCLSELEKTVRAVVNGGRAECSEYRNIYSRIYLKFEENCKIHTIQDIMKLLCFIYDKHLCVQDIEALYDNENNSDDYLIILPFIAIKYKKENDEMMDFVYF